MREHVSVATPEGTTSTQSVWDGQTLLAERDSDGTLYRYVHGPDGSPLSIVRTRPGAADERFNYHTDALGSVVAITSEAGTVVATYRYGAFGELLATGGSDAALAERNPLRYRAYYYDTHAALYYLPARYYDPATARFLSPDPAPASAGDPRTLDRYMYCTGDPVNYYDPTGAVIDVDGDGRIDSEDSIAQTYIYMKPDDPRKAEQRQKMVDAVAAATERAAALAERERIGRNLDWIGQVCLGWSQDDLHAVRSDFSGEGAKTIVRTAYSLPPTSWVLIGAGALLAYGGWQVATTGTIASLTGVGVVPGAGAVVGGRHMIAIGVGLVGVGLTQMEAETGLNIVPWYER